MMLTRRVIVFTNTARAPCPVQVSLCVGWKLTGNADRLGVDLKALTFTKPVRPGSQ